VSEAPGGEPRIPIDHTAHHEPIDAHAGDVPMVGAIVPDNTCYQERCVATRELDHDATPLGAD
jgi:hypothetical protein